MIDQTVHPAQWIYITRLSTTAMFVYSSLIMVVIVTASYMHAVSSSIPLKFDGKLFFKYIPSITVVDDTSKNINNNINNNNNNNNNKIEFKFRTLYPSGLFVLLTGQHIVRNGQHDDTLAVELIQGFLRYSISMYGKRQSSMLLGNNLNDNQWHHVKIIRTNSLSEVQVDDQTKTLISPIAYGIASFNSIAYIGGYEPTRSLVTHHQSNSLNYKRAVYKISVSHQLSTNTFNQRITTGNPSNNANNFIGCLQLITINNRDPIQYFNQGSLRVQVHPIGAKVGWCDATESSPVSLDSSSSLHINHTHLNSTLTRNNEFSVQFSIRTFTDSGSVLQVNDDQNPFHKIGIHLTLRSGKLGCSMWRKYDSATVDLESRAKISDGNWYDVELRIVPGLLSIIVNGIARHKTVATLVSREVRVLKNNDIRFGGGFLGCLNRIMLQQQTNGFEDLLNTGMAVRKNIRGGCNLINHCFPNPCMYGGVCFQTRNNIRCDCTGTEYHGMFCETSLYKSSCAAYQKMGLSETSFCLIDPDGAGPIQPYTNMCRLLKENGQIATVVNHDKQHYVDGVKGDSKFLNSIFHLYKYDLDAKSLTQLIQRSKHCRQRVSYKCRRAGLFDPPNLSWLSSSGSERSYWGNVSSSVTGAPSQYPTCECGLTRTCIDPTKMCNCDALRESWSEDVGYITNKNDLPIRRVTLSNAVSERRSSIYIGPLECFGEADQRKSLNEESNDLGFGNDARSRSNIASKRSFIKDHDVLLKVCFSVRVKEQLIREANDSVRLKLHSERPLPSPQTTQSFATHDGGLMTGPSSPISSLSLNNIDHQEDDNPGNQLSIHEIVLIVVAALAIVFLTIKFILCTLFRKLHGHVTLEHRRSPDDVTVGSSSLFYSTNDHSTTTTTASVGGAMNSKRSQSSESCTKGCIKSPRNYWV